MCLLLGQLFISLPGDFICSYDSNIFFYMLVTHTSKYSALDFLSSATPVSLTAYWTSFLGCPVGFEVQQVQNWAHHLPTEFCFVSQENHLQHLRCLSPKLKCVFWHCLSPMLCYQSISFAISLSIRILIHKYPSNPCLCLHPQCHHFIQWSQGTIIPTALLTGLLASRPASLNAGAALESRDIFPWHSMRSGNFLVKQFSWLPFLTRAQTHRSPEMPHQAPLHLCRCSVAHSRPTLWLHGLQRSSLSFTISQSLLRFTSIEFTSYSLSIAKFSACSVLSCIQIEWKLCYLQKLIQDIV